MGALHAACMALALQPPVVGAGVLHMGSNKGLCRQQCRVRLAGTPGIMQQPQGSLMLVGASCNCNLLASFWGSVRLARWPCHSPVAAVLAERQIAVQLGMLSTIPLPSRVGLLDNS